MTAAHIVKRLADAAALEDLHPTARQYAETLWLLDQIAARLSEREPLPPEAPAPDPDQAVSPIPEEPEPVAAATRPTPATVPLTRPTEDRADESGSPVPLDPSPLRPYGEPLDMVLAAHVPPTASEERLALTRALRPLKRLRPTGDDGELDAAATAHHAAVTDILLPIFHPRVDRWLDVAVVIDDSASMALSAHTVRDFCTIVRDLGGFRDVRRWFFNSDRDKERVELRAENAEGDARHSSAELIEPTGNRLIFVVSDCVGAGWRNGAVGQALDVWARSAPVAVVQPLPQGMWDEAAMDLHPVVLTATGPATANADLRVELDEDPLDPDGGSLGVVVPVLELGADWLARYADLVVGEDGRPYHARALFTGRMRDADWSAPAQSLDEADDGTLVADFTRRASPNALTLARLLAAAAPLTLPVMRVVQHAELPQSNSATLREVLLSGLLARKGQPAVDPEEVVYDFRGRIRDQLLADLNGRRALGVLRAVARHLASRLGTNLDFFVYPKRSQNVSLPDEVGRAFGVVAARVLRSVGGSYREWATSVEAVLRRAASESGPNPNMDEVASATSRVETSGDAVMTSTLDVPVQSLPERPPGYEPLGWKTVPLKNRNFIGRGAMLNDMHVMLVNSGQTAVLLPRAFYGYGGVGKTQLAIEYAHRRKGEFDLVWWIAAEDAAEIRRSLVQLATLIGVPQAGDTNSTIQRVLAALNRPEDHYRNWLVVLDNVGLPATVEGLLPSPQKGRVLITTRESQWEEHGQAVRVDKFARSESIALLSRDGNAPDADTVADRLQDLPISLAQAAAWHRATGSSFAEYLTLLGAELDRRTPEADSAGYPPHAAAAMSLAFQQLQRTSEHAALLLQLASYFGPEWISLDLLHRGRRATPLSRTLGPILRDQAPLQQAVKEIARWELARNDTRNLRFQVHRLVQHMLQSEMTSELRESARETVQAMIAYANPGNPDRISLLELHKHAELSAHIVASGLIESTDEEARQAVLDQIRYRYVVGDYESSEQLAVEAIESWAATSSPDDTFLLIARRHRAGAIAALGNPNEALAIGEFVRAGFERTVGVDHEHTMVTINGIGRDLRALGRFPDAYSLDRENYDRLSSDPRFGPEDRLTLQVGGNLGVDLRMLGEYQQALNLDIETAATTQRAFGPRDQAYLLSASNVARDYYALGQYTEALRYQQELLPIHEEVLGRNHPHVLLARRTVVMCLRKLGNAEDAVAEGRPLVVAFRNRLGDRHPDTLLAMQSLMNAIRDYSLNPADLDEAVTVGEQALHGYEQAFPNHPFRQICRANLAIVYRHRGEARALSESRSAYDELATIFGEENPYTLCAGTNLANGLAGTGQLTEALELSGRVLERSRRKRGPKQPYTLICAVNHAIDLREANDPRGETAWWEAFEAIRSALGSGHPEVRLAEDHKRIDCDIEPPPT
jgi:tetratricopeptide (TPR) repeat protein